MEAMYKKWKRSGAGKGMHTMEEEEEVATGIKSQDLQELRTHGGDKIDFLKSRNPLCLYLWNRLENAMLWLVLAPHCWITAGQVGL
jgi:hypothetical protein